MFIKIAIAYDFDGTLAPGNMQEHSFIPNLKINKDAFWKEANEKAKEIDENWREPIWTCSLRHTDNISRVYKNPKLKDVVIGYRYINSFYEEYEKEFDKLTYKDEKIQTKLV